MASSSSSRSSGSAQLLVWRPTKIMHIQDLPKDDDFLSHLLIEKLGTGTVPLHVHKMDPTRRLPKTHSQDLMRIVRRYVTSKLPMEKAIKQAVDELLTLAPIRYFLKTYTQKQINAFATHASRYFELYHPTGTIEIAHTSRYSHRTGKSELCILATRPIPAHAVITELKGSMANLTDEEDKELKRTDLRNCDIRRDFSVIHSKSMKKNHLFLGPARFVNHDCNNNCELFREGRYITFRTLRPIAVGEELTAHYGDGYFGKKNKDCLCETCEKNGRGGYAPNRAAAPSADEAALSSDSESDSDSDSDSSTSSSSSSSSESDEDKPVLNLNERRTRRGVYSVAQEEEDDDSDEEPEDVPDADAKVPRERGLDREDAEIAAELEADTGSDLTRLSSTPAASRSQVATPMRSSSSSLTELSSASEPKSAASTPFRSIISTRGQKARDTSVAASGMSRSNSKSATPVNGALATRSQSVDSSKRLMRSVSLLALSDKAKARGKGKAGNKEKEDTPDSQPRMLRARHGAASSSSEVRGRSASAGPGAVGSGTPATVATTKTREIPRGPDGKPLPTCGTCLNVLPLISVDSKVVWGLETGSTGSGKKEKEKAGKKECPRCMRHLAIYEVPWPRRVALPGALNGATTSREESVIPADVDRHHHRSGAGGGHRSGSAVGKERTSLNTKNVTKENLSVIDREIAAAVSGKKGKGKDTGKGTGSASAGPGTVSKGAAANKKRVHNAEPEDERRNVKRRKSEPERSASTSLKVKVHVPSVSVLQNVKVTKTYGSTGQKRGRPRLQPSMSSTTTITQKTRTISLTATSSAKPTVKQEESAVNMDMNVDKDQQPRAQNGRFAKKAGVDDSPSPNKRRNDAMEDIEGISGSFKRTTRSTAAALASSGKASRVDDDGDIEMREVQEVFLPVQKVFPRRATGMHAGRLFSKPNPQNFASKAWGRPVVLNELNESGEESEEESSHPVTPEDDSSPGAEIVDLEDVRGDLETRQMNDVSTELGGPPPMRATLSFGKPSPLAFARSRWNSFGQNHAVAAMATARSNPPQAKKASSLSKRVSALNKVYISEGEDSDVSTSITTPRLNREIVHSPPPEEDDDDGSDAESLHTKLRQSYPLLSPSAASKPFIPKGTPRFFSTNLELDKIKRPSFINVGWGDMLQEDEI